MPQRLVRHRRALYVFHAEIPWLPTEGEHQVVVGKALDAGYDLFPLWLDRLDIGLEEFEPVLG